MAQRPPVVGGSSEWTESPRPVPSSAVDRSVTPGIVPETYSAGHGSSYFPTVDNSRLATPSPSAQLADPSSQPSALKGEVPQRKASLTDIDPRSAFPSLELTGSVISAAFCVPYSLEYRKGSDWDLKQRRGTSALFESFAYLSSNETPWNHTLVGWTGEIDQSDELSPPTTPPATTTSTRVPPLNKASAPIPLDDNRPVTPPPTEGLWIGKDDRARLEWQLAHDSRGKTVPVWLYDDADASSDGDLLLKDQRRWRRFAQNELYPLFHYKQHVPSDGRAERKSWKDYQRLNERFAAKILEIYKLGDIVMIHDFHLLLVPAILRRKIPHMHISFFLHIPFPSSEFLRCLPRRNEVLLGMLGANMLGFQSFSYSRHFVSCCTRVLGLPSDIAGVEAHGSKVSVGVFPIGIDAAGVEKLAFGRPEIEKNFLGLNTLYQGKKIIVGRDRLDSVRGVAQKLMAFERFLEEYPEWRDLVVLIQVTSPTSIEEERQDSENKVTIKVSELVAKINGLYGSLGFSPVQHYPQYLSQDEYLALLRAADIGLITSVRDGMNTTSLEYVICQRDNHGPVILSEFSGTAGSLKEAIHINPWDLTGVADAINNALTMSPEKKKETHEDLYKHVTTHNVQAWTTGYIKRLLTVLSSHSTSVTTPILDREKMLVQFTKAKKRLFMIDYDGTLTPIVKDPAAATPSELLIKTLHTLAADTRNEIWIISGRDQEFLTEHLGDIPGVGFSAEHGSFMRPPGSDTWENLAETTDMGWQKEVIDVFQKYTERTQGSFIERKRCALTWHYRRADQELATYMSRECQTELEQTVGKKWEVEVMTGKMNLEVRPTFINKGEIVKRLISNHTTKDGAPTGGEAPEFLISLGDDFTDEDMFRALNASGVPEETMFTVTVGSSSRMTLAHWHLPEPADVIHSLATLAGLKPPSEPLPCNTLWNTPAGKL
ncbi:hypothetical protein VE00_00160 [Pseudogymnoascus sp. WSF 3629]|nr:hypothetical protein VE00_00160 [Pseudogymnoascus sp. WSF 3629]